MEDLPYRKAEYGKQRRMKKYLIFILSLAVLFWYFTRTACKPWSFEFSGKKLLFPSTVQQAVEQNKMDYKPPGYYYSVDSVGTETILDYHSGFFDFEFDNQAKETLYGRSLHSYVFRFKESPGLYDSLKLALETTFKKKFKLVKGTKEIMLLENPKNSFEYNFLTVNPCLTIGIKKSLPGHANQAVTVRFMYDLSEGKMGVKMGNY